MDLSPFRRINPCGFPGLEVTQLADLGVELSVGAAAEAFLPHLLSRFMYSEAEFA